MGCMTDICEQDVFIPARDHFLGTCKEHKVELSRATNRTTFETVRKANGTNFISNKRVSTVLGPSGPNKMMDLLETASGKSQPEIPEKQAKRTSEIRTGSPIALDGSELKTVAKEGIREPLKRLAKGVPVKIIRRKKIERDEPSQNDGSQPKRPHVIEYLDDSLGPAGSSAKKDGSMDRSNIEEHDHIEIEPGARLVSNKDRKTPINHQAVSNYPEPPVKIYKKEKPVYDSDGLVIDQYTGFTSPLSENRIRNKLQRAIHRKGDGPEAIGEVAAHHMPSLA